MTRPSSVTVRPGELPGDAGRPLPDLGPVAEVSVQARERHQHGPAVRGAVVDQIIPSAVLSLLANANHRYVTAENAGRSPLIANRTAIGVWEQFDQINVGGGFIALRAHANGRYVTAENAGRSPLIANRTAIGPWEKFRLVVNSDGSISLLANANGRYVTAGNAGSSPLIANGTAIGAWQKFYRTPS
jgi:hypothetical protein